MWAAKGKTRFLPEKQENREISREGRRLCCRQLEGALQVRGGCLRREDVVDLWGRSRWVLRRLGGELDDPDLEGIHRGFLTDAN